MNSGKKSEKKLLSFILALALTITIVPMLRAEAWAETQESVCINTTTQKSYPGIKEAIAELTAGQTIQLTTNVALDATIVIESTVPAFTLDLNGYVLNGSNIASEMADDTTVASVIYNKGNLVIEDTNHTAIHYFTFSTQSAWTYAGDAGSSTTTSGGINENTSSGSSILVYGGAITGGNGSGESDLMGGGIYNTGTLIISGGSITGNTAYYGGGIYNAGSLTVGAVFLVGNTAYIGGALYNDTNFIYMTGTEIIGNTVTESEAQGAGIYNKGSIAMSSVIINYNIASGEDMLLGGGILNDGSIIMSGGSIERNAINGGDSAYGGGICNGNDSDGASASMSINGVIIKGNTVNSSQSMGGGIFNYGCLTASGVSITENKACAGAAFGAGLVHIGAALTMSGSVKVSGNTALGSASNLFLVTGTTLTPYELGTDTDINVALFDEDLNSTVGAISTTGSDYAKYFKADDSAYRVTANGDALYLEVKPICTNITVSATDVSKIYDGTALTGSSYTSEGSLTAGDVLDIKFGTVTKAGTQPAITGVKIIRAAQDVSDEYDINIVNATLTVNSRSITLTSGSDSKVYDGNPLTNSSISVSGDGFAEGDVATYTFTASQTAIGSGYNTFTVTIANGSEDVTDCYDITTVAGVLTVSSNQNNVSDFVDDGGYSTQKVPVSGDKDIAKIEVSVSGNNAAIKDVTKDVISGLGTDGGVVIDLSGLSKSVTRVTIPKTTFKNVASSDAEGLEIKMPNGTTAVFDNDVLNAVASQAEGKNIQLVIDKDSKAKRSMTKAQKETVNEMNNAVVLDAYFISNGKRISDFKGGEAELTAEYQTTLPVRVWYVADNGDKTEVPCTYDGRNARFRVNHFSHYVIEQLDGSYKRCTQDFSCAYAVFTDADVTAWYHDGVHFCVENEYMIGYDDNSFGPHDNLSRGMIIQMLYNMEGKPAVTGKSTSTYTDVEAGKWYADAIAWAEYYDIMDGYGNNLFGPEDDVTREQLALILQGYAKYKGYDVSATAELTEFTDAAEASDWALGALKWAKAAKLVFGKGNGILDPAGKATRAEAATMIMNFCENIAK